MICMLCMKKKRGVSVLVVDVSDKGRVRVVFVTFLFIKSCKCSELVYRVYMVYTDLPVRERLWLKGLVLFLFFYIFTSFSLSPLPSLQDDTKEKKNKQTCGQSYRASTIPRIWAWSAYGLQKRLKNIQNDSMRVHSILITYIYQYIFSIFFIYLYIDFHKNIFVHLRGCIP